MTRGKCCWMNGLRANGGGAVVVKVGGFSGGELFLSPLRGWVVSRVSLHGLRPFDKLRASVGCIFTPLRG